MSTTALPHARRTPKVYFIDDSATMREVIKIAFRREDIDVVACHDATAALAEIELVRPDLVISDVVMPDKDGYEVCQFIKQHPQLCKTPVVLLSGVVNREVAEKAVSVKADELIRKPFQPQDLIVRVKHLLGSKEPAAAVAPVPAAPKGNGSRGAALSGIFSTGAPIPRPMTAAPLPSPVLAPAAASISVMAPPVAAQAPVATVNRIAASVDVQKLRVEVMRLENLVKKLQSELAAEREYAHALEAHVKTLQDVD
jgi:CheY-like chemotaxis protein